MKLVIPMAGEGSRFSKAGYSLPKPLIDVRGKPMIQQVIDNLQFSNITEYIFIVRKEHVDAFNIDKVLKTICKGKNVSIVVVDRLLKGSAMSILEARNYINTDEEILVANSDQFVEFSKENFEIFKNLGFEFFGSTIKIDSFIFTFRAVSSKWSFVELNAQNRVIRVAEKNPISDIANCGIFWFRDGKQLLKQIDSMVSSNFMVNNEFYLAPSYNFNQDINVYPFFVHKMWGLGTPEDLEVFLNESNLP